MFESSLLKFVPERYRGIVSSLLLATTITTALSGCSTKEAAQQVQAKTALKAGDPTLDIDQDQIQLTQQVEGGVTITETTKVTESGSNASVFDLSVLLNKNILFTINDQTLRISADQSSSQLDHSLDKEYRYTIYYDFGGEKLPAGDIVYAVNSDGGIVSDPHMDSPKEFSLTTPDGLPYSLTFGTSVGDDNQVKFSVIASSDTTMQVPYLPWRYE